MNTLSERFDSRLIEIDHFKKYAAMMPYVGINYGKTENGKIMLIGESNYLPENSTINNPDDNPDDWYNKYTQDDLTVEETEWIDCRDLLDRHEWKDSGHMIYKELNKQMTPYFDITSFNAMSNVIFMNAFQRPSPKMGECIRSYAIKIDFEIGAKTVDEVIQITDPDLVIFVSKYAWDAIRCRLSKEQGNRKIDFTCHPGTGGRYWHNKNYKHGVGKFKESISKQLNC